jgi:hypothetical protein
LLDSISAKENHSTGDKKKKETVTAFFNGRNPNELTHADRIPWRINEEFDEVFLKVMNFLS